MEKLLGVDMLRWSLLGFLALFSMLGGAQTSSPAEGFVRFEASSPGDDLKAYLVHALGLELSFVEGCYPDPLVVCFRVPDGKNLDQVVEQLSDDPAIAFVSPNQAVPTSNQQYQTQTQFQEPVDGLDPILEPETPLQPPVDPGEELPPPIEEPVVPQPPVVEPPVVEEPPVEEPIEPQPPVIEPPVVEPPVVEEPVVPQPPVAEEADFVLTHWGLQRIGLGEVRPRYQGDEKLLVAVISTGVDIHHEALAEVIHTNAGEVPGNGKDDDGNGFVDDVYGYDFLHNTADVTDQVGAGTAAAGLIAGARQLGDKTYLYGSGGKVSLLPIKVNDGNLLVFAWTMFRAFDYALNMGAEVIYFGLDLHALFLPDWGPRQWFQYITRKAEERNVVIVAPAGDLGWNVAHWLLHGSPAAYKSNALLTVGASDSSDLPAETSNRGRRSVDLFAPGGDLMCLAPDDEYFTCSGTPAAAALTAGVVGLLRGYAPELDVLDVRNRILNTVQPMDELLDSSVSGGVLDEEAALFAEQGGNDTDFAIDAGCAVVSAEQPQGFLPFLFLLGVLLFSRRRAAR